MFKIRIFLITQVPQRSFVSIRENGTKRSMIGFVALVTRINNEQTRFTPKCYICAFKSPHYPGFNVFTRHVS